MGLAALRLRCHQNISKKKIWNTVLLITVAVMGWYSLEFAWKVIVVAINTGAEDNIPLFKDVYSQEPWPGVESNISEPGTIPENVHYFWCGNKYFKFENHLSLLSVFRILKPQKIIFHHYYHPRVDENWYHTWFQELKQSFPNIVLRRSIRNIECGSMDILEYILKQLAQEGGVYVGERTILTHAPHWAWSTNFFSRFRFTKQTEDFTNGIIFSKNGFDSDSIGKKLKDIKSTSNQCFDVDEFNSIPELGRLDSSCLCVVIDGSVYPKDIWNRTTRFAELARWLYYGKRAQLYAVQSDGELIPLISHLVWMRTNNLIKTNELTFFHYLSIMSALYVAGFNSVYIHGEVEPYGTWWNILKQNKKVQFIKIERPETIFQQNVAGPSHQSDVVRLSILLRYGGVYQDRDVIWIRKIPEYLRKYPVVACPDWPRNGEWPEVFNMGVMMAKRNSEWLKKFLSTFRYYRDDKWMFNAVMMPYKAYEQHPDQLYVDRYLQVICFKDICHPTWQTDYIRDISDQTPVKDFDWREARSFHFTVPKPPDSLKSPEAIKHSQDIYAQIGRLVLEKSGHLDLIQ